MIETRKMIPITILIPLMLFGLRAKCALLILTLAFVLRVRALQRIRFLTILRTRCRSLTLMITVFFSLVVVVLRPAPALRMRATTQIPFATGGV